MAYLRKICNSEEYVVVEEYIDGPFEKFVNDNGSVCGKAGVACDKAQCFVHYSYERSGKELMIVDIQGSGLKFTDPEIASRELKSDGKVLFCAGNLTTVAINTFIKEHQCNFYCRCIGLKELNINID